MDIFLALITKEELGSCEYDDDKRYDGYRSYEEMDEGEDGVLHDLDEVFDTSYKITSLVDLDGCHLAKEMKLKKNNVLQEDCFDKVDPEEFYTGFVGNSVRRFPLEHTRIICTNQPWLDRVRKQPTGTG